MSDNQRNGQGGQMPQGGYPHQGPGQPQGGYPQGSGPSAPAPKRNMTLPIVLGAVVALVVVGVVVWLLMNNNKPTTTSTPAQNTAVSETPGQTPGETPQTTPAETPGETPTQTQSDPGLETPNETPPAGQAPVMPKEVDGLPTLGDPTYHTTVYSDTLFTRTATAIHAPTVPLENAVARLGEPQKVGVWTCGKHRELAAMACLTEPAYGGHVIISGLDEDPKAIVAFGDKFLALWK